MTDMRGNLDPDAVITARALETVLLSSSVATAVDERLFEALLCRALDVIPGLGGVFGVPDGLRYRFGKRKEQPDIVARDAEADVGKEYAAGIEVKIRSNFNVKVNGSQFDTYASAAPIGCRLTVLVADDTAASNFCARLAADAATSAARWNTVTLAALLDAVTKATGNAPGIDNATARFVLSLAQLT